MYPNLGSSSTQPSAPPPPTSSSSTSSTLSNSSASKPVGFSSLMAQPTNQSTPNTGAHSMQPPYPGGQSSQPPYPGGQSSQPPFPGGQSSQPPFPGGQSSQPPYPGGPSSQSTYPGGQSSQPPFPGGQSAQPPYPTGPSSSSSSSSSTYNNPYATNTQPPNTSNYSAYSLPNTGQQPPQSQGGSGYQQGPYPGQSNPYQNLNPSSGYPGNQQPPPPPPTGYQNPYPPSNPYQQQQGNMSNQNPYRPTNPYPPQQGNTGYQNPYQSSNTYQPQQGGYPPQQPYNPQQQPYNPQQQPYNPQQPPYNPQQQQPFQNPYGSNPQQPQGGYPPYNQPQQPYQSPYGNQPQAGGYNPNAFGSAAINDRLRAIAGRYEIGDALAQRLNILQQFEIVVLCDDSGSMNTPVDGTTGTRWDELRSIVQIVIEIGTVFDSNGVDVHFLNRPPMKNVTDARQVVESFSHRPQGLTPLTSALRQIFQSAASKPGSDKRLLVFVATDGAPTDANGQVDIRSLENLMRNERNANTTYVTFLACTDDEESVSYLSQWDRAMMNVDVVDDYKSEREEIRRTKGFNYPFSFGDYVAKALLGAVDPQMDSLDESANNMNNNFRRF